MKLNAKQCIVHLKQMNKEYLTISLSISLVIYCSFVSSFILLLLHIFQQKMLCCVIHKYSSFKYMKLMITVVFETSKLIYWICILLSWHKHFNDLIQLNSINGCIVSKIFWILKNCLLCTFRMNWKGFAHQQNLVTAEKWVMAADRITFTMRKMVLLLKAYTRVSAINFYVMYNIVNIAISFVQFLY